MKLLIVAFNWDHFSKMYSDFMYCFLDATDLVDVDYYGPGFSTREELKKGLTLYIKEHGAYDAILCWESFLLFSYELFSVVDAYFWHRYYDSDFSISEGIRYAEKTREEFNHLNNTRIIVWDMDVYHIRTEEKALLEDAFKSGVYLLGLGSELVPEYSDSECFGEDNPLTNTYRNLVLRYQKKIISNPLSLVTSSDFCFKPLEYRKYDWTVGGNLDVQFYPQRVMILNAVEDSGYRVYDAYMDREMWYMKDSSRQHNHVYDNWIEEVMDIHEENANIYLRNKVSKPRKLEWRESYYRSYRESKIAYADGGTGRCLVAKYLEIPARGAVLFCDKAEGMDRMGFEDGINMVVVNTENVVDKTRELIKDADRMQRIADAGRKLVMKKFTSRARAQDIIRAISSINKGEFMGSCWQDGCFRIKKSN